ncbi:MAG TPA: alkaline phosphatase D family protein [Candidatus Ruania gallistercoris]|uniref:Alkaline phosphatase D family protein n=1 Tax=Candidatus Ruania gallistercoris TaxID=2838746 RepID=A0A9D2ECS9_9MICO|nr:alkaline phosphatase D family protein [Candidatus Ruania gallistercoris]
MRMTQSDSLFRDTTMRRRAVLGGMGAAALAFTFNTPDPASARVRQPRFRSTPFTLGVASGDPRRNAVVLWTRLAPEKFAPYGGLDPSAAIPVRWQLSTDENFTTIAREGTELAHPEYYFSVHVDARGLRPGYTYFYRFIAGDYVSDVGRTRTAPAAGSRLSELNFAFASCNSFGAGYFTSARHLGDEDLDVVFFLGDYIYEYAISAETSLRVGMDPVPAELNVETGTLERYRLQYSLYKSDPDMIYAHRQAPWIATWDDHEVENEYPVEEATADDVLRRANAYRAYWEHMPLRPPQRPAGPAARMYRGFDFGRLARFSVLDVRQYRSAELADEPIPDSPERRDSGRTMLGAEQESWFLDRLTSSRARWNIAPQQVLMGMLDTLPGEQSRFAPASWDGYQASQQRVLSTVAEHDVSNFVVLTGDVHRNYVLDLKADYDDPDSATIGAEFAGTSLTSGSDGVDDDGGLDDRYAANPHLHWASLQRGYVRCHLEEDLLQVDYREVPYVTTPGAGVSTRSSFVVEAGTAGVQQA